MAQGRPRVNPRGESTGTAGVALAASDAETSPRKVTNLDRTDLNANVKLDAARGVDHIPLTKISGEWMLMIVVWEMIPG